MKITRLLSIGAMLCVALLFVIAAPEDVAAQGGSTPSVIIITATPQGGGTTASATATPTGQVLQPPAPGQAGTPDTREWKAFNVARTELTKKINRNLKYVTNWSWDLLLFDDNMLGCPPQGQTPVKGPAAGYRITIQPLGDNNIYEYRVKFDLSQAFDCGTAGTVQVSGQPLAPPAAGSAVGGGFELGGHIVQLNANTAGRMKQAKMKWVKKQLRYGDGSGPGWIAEAKAQGFKILLSVVGSPSDIQRGGFFDEYAATVAGLARAGADAIEVWNEMNLDREWPNGQINPAQYVQMLSKAYNAIKGANPATIVISGAPAPTGAAGPGGKTAAYWNDDVFMQEMAAAGAASYMDCLGLHYNEGIVSPKQSSGDPRDSYPTRYYSSMLNRGLQFFPGKQACFTELGFLTPEGYGALPGGFSWAQNVTVAQQAQWLAEAAVLSAQSGRVRLMIVWNVDFPLFGADPQAGYAMIRPGGGCPACETLGSVMP